MGIYIKGDFKNPYPNCDECIFGELIRCEAITRRETYDYEVDCPLSEIEVSEDCISREYMLKLQRELHGWMPNDKSHELWQKIKDAPSVIPTVPSEDCISKAYLEQEIENQTITVNEEYWRGWNNALDKVVELIEDAPSVVPTTEPQTEKSREMRLIDADKLIEIAHEAENKGETFCIDSAEELEWFVDDCIKLVGSAPPVTPKPKEGETMRLIELEKESPCTNCSCKDVPSCCCAVFIARKRKLLRMKGVDDETD